MRNAFDATERERSRERNSRDRSYPNNRDISPDFDSFRSPYSHHQFTKKKRVKFDDQEDIRVFKKEDEPATKTLTEEDILIVKQQIEKEVARTYDFNWDQKKHFDALSEQNSMKEQKQKQKELYQKLMGMKEELQFYVPFAMAIPTQILSMAEVGIQSIEREAHSERIKDVLGCYYTHVNEIPNQPIFQVTAQCNKNEPKSIKFNPGGINESEEFTTSKNKNQKALKSILKVPGQNARASASKKSEERQITPRLIWLLKDMQTNKQKYNKQMTELLLKPYKDSGQLDYWMTNQVALNQKLINYVAGQQPPPSNFIIPPVVLPQQQQQPTFNPAVRMVSPSPGNQFRPQFQADLGQGKLDKYKTIPCKYFHSPQGCVKTQNCTFIHDQRYRGVFPPYATKQQQGQSSFGNQGYNANQSYKKSQQPLQPYSTFVETSQTPKESYGSYRNQGTGMYNNQNIQYSQRSYPQQQHVRFQNYNQGQSVQQQPYSQGNHMPKQGYGQGQIMPQQMYGQQKQGQYGYNNSQQGQGGYMNPQQQPKGYGNPSQIYYGQGQGQGQGPRTSSQRR